jgi:CRISPR/Cas system-associated endonuclease/helicase Cas3
MDNSIFKSLTRGVKFTKPKPKREAPPPMKKEEIKIESDSDEELKLAPPKKKKKLSEAYVKQKELEATNKIRKQHNINVKGAVEKVKPIESFDELFERFPLNEKLVENIKNYNYSKPTAVQMQVLPLFLEKKALKVVAPTGSGKLFHTTLMSNHNNKLSFKLQEKHLRSLFHSSRIFWIIMHYRPTPAIRFKPLFLCRPVNLHRRSFQ